MTDLKNVLGLALDGAPDGAAADGHAHAGARPGGEDDLARGRRLLRRRTRNRMLAASAGVAAIAVAAVVPTLASGSGSATGGSHPAAAGASRTAASASRAAAKAAAAAEAAAKASHAATSGGSVTLGIKLVDYTGSQPPGYQVKMIPDHWVIQGSNPYALTIAPPNDTDKNPNSFLGKLVVMQESFDTSQAQGWTSVNVPGHTVYYSVQDGTASVVIEQTAGRWLDVQAPTSLHWTEKQEVQFGLGVTILSTAQEGEG